MAGLLLGFLGSPAEAMTTPLSRWPAGEGEIRYQVSLFPFGFAPAEEQTVVSRPVEWEPEYEIGFRVLEWWGGIFG